jgi:hypothetical protein
MPGCFPDCRNFLAFPNEIYCENLIENIHNFIGNDVLIYN